MAFLRPLTGRLLSNLGMPGLLWPQSSKVFGCHETTSFFTANGQQDHCGCRAGPRSAGGLVPRVGVQRRQPKVHWGTSTQSWGVTETALGPLGDKYPELGRD